MKNVIKVIFICHGNICRSTMAQSYFTWLVSERGLSDLFEVDSAATSREEIGCGPHWGTVQALREHGIPVVPHRARQMTRSDTAYYDLIIGMDEENLWNMQRIARRDEREKLFLLLEFQEDGTLGPAEEVDDPWYSGDFDATYRDVSRGCEGLLAYCRKELL